MPAQPAHDYDLLIRAGRVFCEETGLDGPGAVAVKDGRIAASGPEVGGSAAMTFDFPDAVVMPGLVDLHAHPARGGSRYGVDPDAHFLSRGVTTVMSQGDAGASNWPAYRDRVIRVCRTRVILAINLSVHGESHPDACFPDLQAADVEACVAVIESGGDAIWGIAGQYRPQQSHAAQGDHEPGAGSLRTNRQAPAGRHATVQRLVPRRPVAAAARRRRGHLLLQRFPRERREGRQDPVQRPRRP